MPVIQFGSKMKSPYLEQWRPEPGTLVSISLLSLNPIGTQSHWVDLSEVQIRDRCQCVEGFCCKAFGPAWLTYFFPIWVYDKPGSVEGTFFIFGATATQYRNLINLAQAGDLLHFDIQVQCNQQGAGIQTSFTIMPNSTLRKSMPEDMIAKIQGSVDTFYQEEDKLCRPMTAEAYNSMLQKVNYDFHASLPLIKKQFTPAQPGFYPNGVPGATPPAPVPPALGPFAPRSVPETVIPYPIPPYPTPPAPGSMQDVEVTQIPPKPTAPTVGPMTAEELQSMLS